MQPLASDVTILGIVTYVDNIHARVDGYDVKTQQFYDGVRVPIFFFSGRDPERGLVVLARVWEDYKSSGAVVLKHSARILSDDEKRHLDTIPMPRALEWARSLPPLKYFPPRMPK